MSPAAADRRRLGLSYREWYLFKVHEWCRLYGTVPSAQDWNLAMARAKAAPFRLAQIAQRHADELWPNASSVVAEFGSWSAFLEVAGLPTRGPGIRDVHPVPEPAPEVLDRLAELWRDDVLWASGGGLDEVARRLDLHPGIALSFTRRIEGLPERDLSPPDPVPYRDVVVARRARVTELWIEGLSAEEIARQLGVSKSTIQQDATRLRRAGVALPKRGPAPRALSPDQVAVARRLRDEGWSPDRIARLLGVSEQRIVEALVPSVWSAP